VSVGGRTYNHLRADIIVASWSVIDEKLLTETLREPLTEQARENVGVPPAAAATMMRTGRAGSDWALAICDTAGRVVAAPTARLRRLLRECLI
jgi:hypothetical protein